MSQDLNSPAWLRSTVEDGQCVFLSDRSRYSEEHRAHAFRNRGLIVGDTSAADRYFVACLAVEGTMITDCEVCGEPSALIRGSVAAVVLYSGDDYDAAVDAYNDWFN